MPQKLRLIPIVILAVLVITPSGDYILPRCEFLERNVSQALRVHVANSYPNWLEIHYWLNSDVLPSGKVFS